METWALFFSLDIFGDNAKYSSCFMEGMSSE